MSATNRRVTKRAIRKVCISRDLPIPDWLNTCFDDDTLLEFANHLDIDNDMLIEVRAEVEDLDVAWRRRERKKAEAEAEAEAEAGAEILDYDLFS